MLTDQDIYLFREGTHGRLFDQLGSRLAADGDGAHFAVWAPNAAEVSVIGDWNEWNARADRLAPRLDESGIWEGSVPGVECGQAYKYRIVSRVGGYRSTRRTPSVCSARRLPPLLRGCGRWTTHGMMPPGWVRGPSATPWTRPCRSTSCMWDRGAARMAILSTIESWPMSWRII